ncbi:MAG: glycosyltransferase family 2 protein [Myxococcota bacterium]|nr:glycosyltransferase family 2 protein [Myxococcota bacterium]
MSTDSLSIVVISHLGGDLLARCVESLRPQLREGDELEVLISAEVGEASLQGLDLEVVHLGRNVGFAKAANVGFFRSIHPWILLLNDDTLAEPGFLDALREAAVEPGLYQPKILLADGSGRLDNIGHGLFPDGSNWARGRRAPDSERYSQAQDIGACSGAAMLVSREVLSTVGSFDGDLEAFGEDVDLSLRARRAGFPIRSVPEARIQHHLGASYGRYAPKKLFLVERNRFRAAVRSLPASALMTMPLWTSLRLAGLSLASVNNRGYASGVGKRAALATAGGLLAGIACLPDALRKRREDAQGWKVSEGQMWSILLRNRIRVGDVLR